MPGARMPTGPGFMVPFAAIDPRFRRLHTNPRFVRILREIGVIPAGGS